MNEVSQLPQTAENGTIYLVGNNRLYIYFGEWYDAGYFSIEGPQGPVGPEGPQGQAGTDGTKIYIGTLEPQNVGDYVNGDLYLNIMNGNLYNFDNRWILKGSLKGPQGIQGPRGIEGPQGLTGPQGPQGPQGLSSPFYRVVGTLNDVSELPAPETAGDDAYLVNGNLYGVVGDMWHNYGPATVDHLVNPQNVVFTNGNNLNQELDTYVKITTEVNKVYGTSAAGTSQNYTVSESSVADTLVLRDEIGGIKTSQLDVQCGDILFSLSHNGYNGLQIARSGVGVMNFGGSNFTSYTHIPISNNTYDLGSSSNAWKDLYLSGKLNIKNANDYDWGLTVNSGGLLQIIGNDGAAKYHIFTNYIKPGLNNAQDLGQSTNLWRNLYISGNLSDGTNDIKVSEILKKVYYDPLEAKDKLYAITEVGQTEIQYTMDNVPYTIPERDEFGNIRVNLYPQSMLDAASKHYVDEAHKYQNLGSNIIRIPTEEVEINNAYINNQTLYIRFKGVLSPTNGGEETVIRLSSNVEAYFSYGSDPDVHGLISGLSLGSYFEYEYMKEAKVYVDKGYDGNYNPQDGVNIRIYIPETTDGYYLDLRAAIPLAEIKIV